MTEDPLDVESGIETPLVDLLIHILLLLPLVVGVVPVMTADELATDSGLAAIAFFTASKLALAAVVVVTDWSFVISELVVVMFISSVQVRANRSPTKIHPKNVNINNYNKNCLFIQYTN